MKTIVLDTCIVVHYLRKSPLHLKLNDELKLDDPEMVPVISSVTKGELLSFVKQRGWGVNKTKLLDEFLQYISFVDITFANEELQNAYAIIDAYSKRKIADDKGNMLKGSAIKMGKNDLWIAATALVLDAPLVTTDNDFNHLAGSFLTLKKY
ncbi:MAG: type II toxin-antitoxin system VapC family toxin [Ignavibacteriae bacterium]|nr:type II toxin-antitoxin system VapC family toxin [Ignavibacteriota bacterium]